MILLTMPTRRRGRIPRIHAFEAQGVNLSFPSRSWSGLRAEDRSVVLAMRDVDVTAHADGCSCLLWSPALEANAEWLDRPSMLERLQHCRLAVLHGTAGGLLTYGPGAEVERDVILSVEVIAHGKTYWAVWGRAARARRVPKPVARILHAYAYC